MSNNAPTIANLNSDAVAYAAGAPPLRLDAGVNAVVSDPDPFGFVVTRVGAGLSGGPLFVVEVPDGSGRLYVVEKSGTIRILDPDTGAVSPTPFLSVAGQIATAGEQGLLGFALAPDFASSGTFYIYMTNTGGDNEVRRYQTFPGNPLVADPGSADRILLIPHPGASNHNAGWIAFGPDGNLYIATGDGGVGANAQSIDNLAGKILRIDPGSDAFPGDPDRDYAIPPSNPFASAAGRDEIYVLGLRNPFRASFDPLTGDLWIGDVGAGRIEEIDFNPPDQGGTNFGWDVLEGTLENSGSDPGSFTPPVAEYGHGTGPFQGNSVTGGLVYRGPIAALDGHYVFGDFFDELWSVPTAALALGSTLPGTSFTLRNVAFTPNAGTINQITSFATDQAGNLYISDLGGEVFQVAPSATPNFAGGSLAIAISAGGVPAEDRLGLATGGAVTLSNGTNVDSQVRIGGVLVGAIAPGGTGQNGEELVILFSGGATAARISTLVQAVTYVNAAADPTAGSRTITIRLNDGAGTAGGGQDRTIVTTSVVVADDAVLTGTPGDDLLEAGAGDDAVLGLAGTDTLRGFGGADILAGGRGADALDGGDGDDTADYGGNFGAVWVDLTTGQGRWNYAHGDTLANVENATGTEFNDRLVGDAGVNRLEGRGGNDTLDGAFGGDSLDGGAGTDTADYAGEFGGVWIDLETGVGQWNSAQGDSLVSVENAIGTTFTDWLRGDNQGNRLDGGDGDDSLLGRGGNDVLVGGRGADAMGGGAGNDVLAGGLGPDALDGGADVDTADYSGNYGGVWINFITGQGKWNYAEGDTLSGIERVIGTSFADTFESNGVTNVFTGGLGNDTFVFRPGFSQDIITDFDGNGAAAGDTIRFRTGIFTGFSDMMGHASQQGADVVIQVDAANFLRLQDTQLADLHSSDFIFG